MNDEQAKSLGLRALALGMPWVNWLLDGSDGYRVLVQDLQEHSWPDFRDPLTEAWLWSWVEGNYPTTCFPHVDFGWVVSIMRDEEDVGVHAATRAEALIKALEQLRG